MLQMFGQMMMMPISMATAGMNMMAAPFGGARGDGRAGWDASLGRWLGGCCGSREGPRSGGAARSLDSRGSAGWTAREGRSGSGNPGSAGGYRSGTETRPSVDYRSGTESRPSVDYRSGSESRPAVEYRSGAEPRSGYGSGSRSERKCGCGKRSGGGGCGCGSERARTTDHYREERRMSDCNCCDDSNNRNLKLAEYWIVNVKYCTDPEGSAFLGHGYQAYTEQYDRECDLETWLLGKWVSLHPDKVKPGEEKYLRIKVQRIGDWPTVEDCCPREVDVLRDINRTLERAFHTWGLGPGGPGGPPGGGGGGGGYSAGRGESTPSAPTDR